MHEEILTPEQKLLLPLVSKFLPKFGLVGGTAIALYLGHRRSIDFDLFTQEDFDNENIKNLIRPSYKIEATLVEFVNQLTIVANQVKFTFYKYPFPIKFSEKFENFAKLPDLLTLAAMKAFALGGRAKWKDYVDLYFLFNKFPFKEVVIKAQELFGSEFNEKLFREQLSYFDDIDYSEQVDFMPGFEVDDLKVKNFLSEVSLSKD